MRAALRSRSWRLALPHNCLRASQIRHASLTGAISRGVREAQKSAEDRRGIYNSDATRQRKPLLRDSWEQERDVGQRKGRWQGHEGHGDVAWTRKGVNIKSYDFRPRKTLSTGHEDQGHARWIGHGREIPEKGDYLTQAPRTIPYTAADSQFLYGLHSVEAAIRANRRTFHKLYISVGADGGVRSETEKDLYSLASKANIPSVRVAGAEWKQKLSQLAEGRAHNGFVLEASPIPTPSIESLDEVEHTGASWTPRLLDGTPLSPFHAKAQNRFPLLLLLDGVTDTANVGAILRSVCFFGVDGVVRPELGATRSGPMLKSSAGASEYVPLFSIRHDMDFLRSCQANGWHVATAVAPDAEMRVIGARRPKPAAAKRTPDRILESKPTILVLGNEGTGVRSRLSKVSDSFISIQDAPSAHPSLDSLNVSVAAAILMRDLVKPFLGPGSSKRAESERSESNARGAVDEDLF